MTIRGHSNNKKLFMRHFAKLQSVAYYLNGPFQCLVNQSQTCCCFSKLRLAMRANESGFPLSVDIGDPDTSATTASSDVDDMSSDKASF